MADAQVVAVGVGEGELAHPPRLVGERGDRKTGGAETGVPLVDVGDDEVAARAVDCGLDELFGEVEVEDALAS